MTRTDILGGERDRPVMRMLLSSCSWASWSAVAATSLTSHQFLHTNTPLSACHQSSILWLDIKDRSLMRGLHVKTIKRVVMSFAIATNRQLDSSYQ